MRTIVAAKPRPELREFVRSYAQREASGEDAQFEQPAMASLEPLFSFSFKDLETIRYTDGQSKVVSRFHVLGLLTHPTGCSCHTGALLAFGIFLKPLALWQLFRIPAGDIADRDMTGEELLGPTANALWLKLAECRSFAERILVAEEYLLPFARNARRWTYTMKSANHLFRERGATRVEDLAHRSGLSVRQYQRRFTEEIGIGPKMFGRIRRFELALDAKRLAPTRSWLSVAHALGYFDQMHMIRDFKALGGDAPGQVIQQSGDLQPWSVIAPLSADSNADNRRKLRTRSESTKNAPCALRTRQDRAKQRCL